MAKKQPKTMDELLDWLGGDFEFGRQLVWLKTQLAGIRQKQGLSLQDVATKLCCSKGRIAELETWNKSAMIARGRTGDMQLLTLFRMLRLYGVQPRQFFGDMPDFRQGNE